MKAESFITVRKFLLETLKNTCNDFIAENEKHDCIGKLCVVETEKSVVRAYYEGMYVQNNNVYYKFNKVKKDNRESSVGYPALRELDNIVKFYPVPEVKGFRSGDIVCINDTGEKGIVVHVELEDQFGCEVAFVDSNLSEYFPFNDISLCE